MPPMSTETTGPVVADPSREHEEELSVDVVGGVVTVAITIDGEGRAMELTPAEARALARTLETCAAEAERGSDGMPAVPIRLPARRG